MVFDAGIKKTCRHNQYFGVKAAQERVAAARGRHHLAHPGLGQVADDGLAGQVDSRAPADARVLLITDRTELDEQIEGVFNGVNETIYRTEQRRRPARHAQQVSASG